MRYRTIVADPPWHYGKAGAYSWREGRPSGDTRPMLAYGTMTVEQIAGLPVAEMAEADAARAWGFDPVKLLVWAKPPTGFSVGGTFGNSTEFVLYARRGKNVATSRVSRDWWDWPRSGGHSAKPEAFLDVVEQTHPAPYLEMFARRARFGWDYWGDESLGTASMPEVAA
jgi:N6-adenosine-specific RNA methylase IME4